jgi:hypothetical protein
LKISITMIGTCCARKGAPNQEFNKIAPRDNRLYRKRLHGSLC